MTYDEKLNEIRVMLKQMAIALINDELIEDAQQALVADIAICNFMNAIGTSGFDNTSFDTINTGVINEIRDERERQQTVEGYDTAHDDESHEDGRLAHAAAAYLLPDIHLDLWPWDIEFYKPKDRRRDLVRAAALVVAEIERLDRKDAVQKV